MVEIYWYFRWTLHMEINRDLYVLFFLTFMMILDFWHENGKHGVLIRTTVKLYGWCLDVLSMLLLVNYCSQLYLFNTSSVSTITTDLWHQPHGLTFCISPSLTSAFEYPFELLPFHYCSLWHQQISEELVAVIILPHKLMLRLLKREKVLRVTILWPRLLLISCIWPPFNTFGTSCM